MSKKTTQKNEHGVSHITPVGGNVFSDLGFAPKQAAEMLAEVDGLIEAKMDQGHPLICERCGEQWCSPEQEYYDLCRSCAVATGAEPKDQDWRNK